MPYRRPVALDHNFPEPILRVLDQHLKEIELVWVRDIDARLPGLDDDELVHALAGHDHTVLVTGDYHMLDDPAVLVALCLTRLTLLTIEKAGHDPLIATGAHRPAPTGAVTRFARSGGSPTTGVCRGHAACAHARRWGSQHVR